MVRKVAKSFTPERLHVLPLDVLWEVAESEVNLIWSRLSDSADDQAFRSACRLYEVVQELKLRGTQLELPLDGV